MDGLLMVFKHDFSSHRKLDSNNIPKIQNRLYYQQLQVEGGADGGGREPAPHAKQGAPPAWSAVSRES